MQASFRECRVSETRRNKAIRFSPALPDCKLLTVGWLEFIAAIVGSIAWPAAVVWVVFLFRHQIRALLPYVSRVQVGPFQMDLGELLDEAERTEQKLEEHEQKALSPAEELDEDLQTRREDLYARAQESPYNAVIYAWLSVTATAEAAALRNNLRKDSPNLNLRRVVQMLVDRGKAPQLLIEYADQLLRLHKQTVRVDSVTEEEA